MTGRAEVARLRQKLDATFSRAAGAQHDLELLADFARYLCVLVSGFIEQAVQELLLEHVRGTASPAVQRYVESKIRRFTNPKAQRLITLLGDFDDGWRIDLEGFIVDERHDAIDSVVNLRNSISHGKHVGVTISRITQYYSHISDVIDHIADLCDPL